MNDSHRNNALRPSSDLLYSEYDKHFTLRALGVGLAIGILFAFCNIYFGLQTGWGNGLSIPASLMGFAMFRAVSRQLTRPFTSAENVLIQTVAGATGTMPLGSGFTGIMPAIDFLLDRSEGAPVDLSLWRLIVWSIGLSLFGVIFAVPLRREVIVREKLKFPTGTATAIMIGLLHRNVPDKHANVQDTQEDEAAEGLLPDDRIDSYPLAAEDDVRSNEEVGKITNDHSIADIQLLVQSFGVSGFYTFFAYFVPQIRDLPILGTYLANTWLWTLNPSPAYVGQGMIMGPATTFPMLLGAMFGWGILSPLAKKKGWAPGPISDWNEGSRGWIAWIALVIMLTDALINLCWFVMKSALRFTPALNSRIKQIALQTLPSFISALFVKRPRGYAPVTRRASSASAAVSPPAGHRSPDVVLDDAPPEHLVSNTAVSVMFIMSLILCVISIQISFGRIIPPQLSAMAVFIGILLSIMGVRAVGETDINPASGIGKFSQLLFALFTSRDNPHRILINILAGQVADSGAGQSGDMMQDLKTGHLLRASPKAQFLGAVIGSLFGAIISPFIYRMYTSVYDLPSTLFPIPQAYVWIFAARLVTGRGLPEMVGTFALCATLLFTISTILRIYLGNHPSPIVRQWQPFVPSGIAVAIGMYNPPSFTLARAIGGTLSMWWIHYRNLDQTRMTILASGLVLGEGIISIVSLALASLDVPHL